MPTMSEQLDQRLAGLDEEIARIAANAATAIKEVEAQKVTLMQAKAILTATPAAERLIGELKKLGIL